MAKEMSKLSFEEAIEDLEDFFIQSSDKELYGFILEALGKDLIENVIERTGEDIKSIWESQLTCSQ